MIISFAQKTAQRLSLGMGAAAIAIAGALAPAPARANTEDLARFLFGAIAVALIVRGFENTERVRPDPRRAHNILPNDCLGTVRIRGRNVDVYDARCLQRADVRRLPQRCETTIRTGNTNRRVYTASCLHEAGFRAERPQAPAVRTQLPQSCETSYRVQGGRILPAYSTQCLQRAGLRNLPRSCEVNTRDGQRLMDSRCLQDAGFRPERGHVPGQRRTGWH